MNANEKNTNESVPRDINAAEVNQDHPAKAIKSQDKIDIKESGLGREQGQTPADEHIEDRLSQIDPGTVAMQQSSTEAKQPQPEADDADSSDGGSYMNDANVNTDRDTGNSNKEGWDAETSKTGRHK